MNSIRYFIAALAVTVLLASADATGQVYSDFESFTIGASVDGQGGWRATNPNWDEEIADLGGNLVWRVSNAVTSGSFGDQPIAPGSGQYAGETGSVHNFTGNPPVTDRFYAQFTIRSATGAPQPGLDVTVSPDDGAGRRQSFLSIEDNGAGIDIDFFDSAGNHPVNNPNGGFQLTEVALGLSYTEAHTIAFDITFVDGNVVDMDGNVFGNDVVEIYVDGVLVHSGTTWESYYTTTTEGQTPPTKQAIDTLLFRLSTSAAMPGSLLGAGFYIDNVYIADAPPAVQNLTTGGAYSTIQAAVDDANAGDVIQVAPGAYNEDVTINTQVTIVSSDGAGSTTVSGPIGGGFATFDINASGTILDGFTITRDGNALATWNDPLNSAGISIQGAGNVEVRNCVLTANRTGIDINASSGNNIHHNEIDFNHTGMILRNGCPNNTIESNEVTNNRTVGILWLGPPFLPGDATGCKFFNNKIEGNWYAEIENRTVDGGLKDFSGNWLGTDAPTVSTTLGAEPSYTVHVPVEFGGSATDPGGNPAVRDATALYDYTPWLDSNTDTDGGSIGFEGDFETLNVDDDSPQSGNLGRIQEAIDLVSGSTVNILPGTYIEAGQVVLDEDITITGDAVNRPVIMTDSDTSSAGDARGMWLVNPGVVADLSNLVFDGTGRLIWQAIRHRGSGPITNCAFNNIQFNASGPSYAGTAIAAFGDGVTDISQCDFSNIGRIGIQYFGAGISGSNASDINYTGKGVGDFLDYSFDIGGGAVVSIERLSVSGNRGVASSDGSTSAGLIVSTFFGAGTEAVIQDSVISDNTTGIFVGFDPSDTALVTANYNRIFGNDTGLRNTSLTNVVDAEFNFWGAASGPLDDAGVDEAGNPPCFDVATMVNNDGAGNAVESSNVDYCPWLLGDASLTLEIAAGCPDDTDSIEPGHQIEVELWMRDLLDPATGYQAFVTFDATALEYKGMLSSYTSSPFPTGFDAIDMAETAPGVLTLSRFDVFNGAGTDADSLLATLVFEVTIDGECGITSLGFDTAPASELSFEGTPLITGNVGTPMITLDDSAPMVTQGAISDCYDSLALAEAAALAATSATDNCTSSMDLTTVVENSTSATCDTTITVRVTDACGNFTDVDYMTRIDSDAPMLTAGTIDGCYDTVANAEAAAIAATGISDNCPGSIDVVASTVGTCDVTITVTATDFCGNSDSVDYMTRVDDEAPMIAPGSIAPCYPTVAAAEAAAIAQATLDASDNCLGGLDYSASTVGTCNATVTVTVTDFCGNSAMIDYMTRIDDTPPMVSAMDIVVPADAGMCTALVTLIASATDDCDGPFDDADLTFIIDSDNDGFGVSTDDTVMGSGGTFVFAQGITDVRATATDACGNEGVFDFTVTVEAVNLVNLTVTLDGVMLGMGDSVSRMIEFTARDGLFCAASTCEVVTFTGMPATGSVQVAVECGSWDSICAKDPQHTLSETVPLVLNGSEYDAGATHILRGGDTDNDSDVDINDVTLFIAQFGNVDMGIGSGMNACPYDGQRDADFDLNTVVGAEDFTILSSNWLEFTTCVCSASIVDLGDEVPAFKPLDRNDLVRRDLVKNRKPVLTRVQISSAPNIDLAIQADLNQDGEVGFEDVEIFEVENGFDSRLSDAIQLLEQRQLQQMTADSLTGDSEAERSIRP